MIYAIRIAFLKFFVRLRILASITTPRALERHGNRREHPSRPLPTFWSVVIRIVTGPCWNGLGVECVGDLLVAGRYAFYKRRTKKGMS